MQLNNLEVIVFQLDDFGKFNINDIVDTPWNVKYKITGKKSISNLKLAITEDDCHSAMWQRCPSFPR